jgi:hypothetical protein
VAGAGLIYGLVGVFVLGVDLDYVLIGGALMLGAAAATIAHPATLLPATGRTT